MKTALAVIRDLLFRLFPHRTVTGLVEIGRPLRGSPVLLTCNYALTVRRLERVLAGRDVWLLVADSRGINVWCAAGGGHLTHHDVVSVIRTSEIADRVDTRTVVLPQLSATGIERRKIEAIGWRVTWGPARLEDLPEYIDRNCRLLPEMRTMRFPLWERLEMATVWILPMALIGGLLAWLLVGRVMGLAAVVTIAVPVAGIFALLPRLAVTGAGRWLTFAAFAVVGLLAGSAVLVLLGPTTHAEVVLVGAIAVLAMAILSIDLAGTTPWYPSEINSFGNRFRLELVEEACTGAETCVEVCPRDVLRMDSEGQRVEIYRPAACLRCAACIVQCPDDALRFRFADGRVVAAETVRSTRLNLLGRRTVELE